MFPAVVSTSHLHIQQKEGREGERKGLCASRVDGYLISNTGFGFISVLMSSHHQVTSMGGRVSFPKILHRNIRTVPETKPTCN